MLSETDMINYGGNHVPTHADKARERKALMEHPSLKPLLRDLLTFAQTAQATFVRELSEAERAAIGTSAHWSARDHLAHLTFWKQEDCVLLAALARSETPSSAGDTDTLNKRVFEEQRERSWEAILLDAQQVQAALLASVERLSEDDLAATDWLPPTGAGESTNPESQPLWDLLLSHGFWHPLEHLTQFYLERNEVLRATQLQHAWVDQVNQPEVPAALRGIGLATLASFYLLTQRPSSAQEPLRQALAFHPALAHFFAQIPEVASLLGK